MGKSLAQTMQREVRRVKPRAEDAEDATGAKKRMRIEPQGTDCHNRSLTMTENQIGKRILDLAFEIHIELGLTQLRLANLRLGYLINFGEEHLKDGIKRLANRLKETA